MNEDVRRSRQAISRRRALGLGGTIGLGGLLAACGGGGTASGGSTPTSSASSSSGGTATVSPSTATTTAGTDVLALLDQAGTCSLAQEQTQGPYWFDVDSIRSDIREERPGTPLTLAMRVQDVSSCSSGGTASPVADSVVEIWHCDAGGVYSGFESGSLGAPDGGAPGGRPPSGGAPDNGGPETPGSGPGASGETSDGSYTAGDTESTPTDDGTYLRGAQVANADGVVQFTTVFPGWYRGRTTHIHLKVHKDRKTVLTTQLFFDDDLTTEVYEAAPYSDHTGRDTFNDGDTIFDSSGLLTVAKQADGYLAVINLGVDV